MAEAAVTRLLALCNRTKRLPQNRKEQPGSQPASFLASEKSRQLENAKRRIRAWVAPPNSKITPL